MDATEYSMKHWFGNILIDAYRTTEEVTRSAVDTFHQIYFSKGSNHE